MKKISIYVYENAVVTAIAGTIDILYGVNNYLISNGQQAAFEIELVGKTEGLVSLIHDANYTVHTTLKKLNNTDLLIIPAFYPDPDSVLNNNQEVINKIKQLYLSGTEIASLCAGAVLVAESGILNGKRCTSHWMTVEYLIRNYPEIQIMPESVITDYDGIYSSGGAFSSFRLVLYLIEKYCGKDVCNWASRMFSIDLSAMNQAQFTIFQGYKNHKDDRVLLAQQFIERNYQDPISVESVAEHTNMSKRNFVRRFKNATQNTPQEYIHRVKVEVAKKDLENATKDINQIIYSIGYNDLKSFRTIFKRYTGLTPQGYRNKYSVVYV